MNKTLVAFAAIIIVGLIAVFYFSSQNSPTKGPDFSIINTPTPNINIPNNINNDKKVTQAPPQQITPVTAHKAHIKTVKGDIDIELYPQDAPKTVTNFSTLAKYKFYDGLTFHRVEPGFVIQGGDPNGNGTGGTSIYGGPFEDEIKPDSDLYKTGYVEGIVAMANSGPNTNGSQFFIMWADNPSLPSNYTIFGKVTQGMDTVHKMVAGDKINSITVE